MAMRQRKMHQTVLFWVTQNEPQWSARHSCFLCERFWKMKSDNKHAPSLCFALDFHLTCIPPKPRVTWEAIPDLSSVPCVVKSTNVL
jgi:hypothetical protein